MKPRYIHRFIAVVVSMVLCTTSAFAELVSTERIAAANQSQSDRAKVGAFLERSDVQGRLQTLGVDGLVAKDRVAALSDDEVHALAGKIDAMPAGGNLSQSDLILILLVAILVAIAV